jgi:hypothetical protein
MKFIWLTILVCGVFKQHGSEVLERYFLCLVAFVEIWIISACLPVVSLSTLLAAKFVH